MTKRNKIQNVGYVYFSRRSYGCWNTWCERKGKKTQKKKYVKAKIESCPPKSKIAKMNKIKNSIATRGIPKFKSRMCVGGRNARCVLHT